MSFWNGKGWVGATPPSVDVKRRSRARHVAKSILEAGLVTALTFGLIAGSTFAAKGGGNRPAGGGAGGGLTGPVMVRDADASGSVTEADDVTFNVSTTATDRPFVGLRCYQGSSWVYDGYVGYFPGAMFDPWFTLSGPYWDASADASCTARLFYYNKRGGETVLSTLSFAVAH